jgi:hypothetical protein
MVDSCIFGLQRNSYALGGHLFHADFEEARILKEGCPRQLPHTTLRPDQHRHRPTNVEHGPHRPKLERLIISLPVYQPNNR